MRENFTSVIERQGKRFCKFCLCNQFFFTILDEFMCEENAFAEMATRFVALPPTSPVDDRSSKAPPHPSAPPRAQKRKVESTFPVGACSRVLRSSARVQPTTLFLELVPTRKKSAAVSKIGSGIVNLGMTCYVASALQVALSVRSWTEVLLLLLILFFLYNFFISEMSEHVKAHNQTRGCRSCQGVWRLQERCIDSGWCSRRCRVLRMVCENKAGIERFFATHDGPFRFVRLRHCSPKTARNQWWILRPCCCFGPSKWFCERFCRESSPNYDPARSEWYQHGFWSLPEWKLYCSVSPSFIDHDSKLIFFQRMLFKNRGDSCSWRAFVWPWEDVVGRNGDVESYFSAMLNTS